MMICEKSRQCALAAGEDCCDNPQTRRHESGAACRGMCRASQDALTWEESPEDDKDIS
jgi:hypothetical protein